MIKVEFLGPIDKEAIEVDAKTLSDVAKILKNDPKIKEWLDKCAVAVNDTLVTTLDISLNDGDRVSLLPPVCGG